MYHILQYAGTYTIWLVVWNINFIFPYIGLLIIPTDELIFFRGVAQPPTSYIIADLCQEITRPMLPPRPCDRMAHPGWREFFHECDTVQWWWISWVNPWGVSGASTVTEPLGRWFSRCTQGSISINFHKFQKFKSVHDLGTQNGLIFGYPKDVEKSLKSWTTRCTRWPGSVRLHGHRWATWILIWRCCQRLRDNHRHIEVFTRQNMMNIWWWIYGGEYIYIY